jgi:DNA (cytosine-5)-methyltransferase 1
VTLTVTSGHVRVADELTSLELFAGAGGLALGIAEAGFRHLALIEYDRAACESLRANADRVPLMNNWPVYNADAANFPFGRYRETVDLLAAGVPCQPFSLAGKHGGHRDDRNLFPVVFRAVRDIQPKVVLIENVRGLTRPAFAEYLEHVESCLRFPHAQRKPGESWRSFTQRLKGTSETRTKPRRRYHVGHVVLNAADFGVPQRRERLFIIAFRADLGVDIAHFLNKLGMKYSEDSLLYSQWVEGTYWREHAIPLYEIPSPPSRLKRRLERLRQHGKPLYPRWKTVRDALRSRDPLMGWSPLPEPMDHEEYPGIANHVGNPGARSYAGHTGSLWDAPAKTLKAGYNGVPGGENALRITSNQVRYFTVREAARLQGFPDEYHFAGAWSEAFRQIGNSVPVTLASHVATAIVETLQSKSTVAADRFPG